MKSYLCLSFLDGDRIYLFNKLNVLITPLVRAHLEIDNKSVAIIKNDRIIGIGPGKTNIRVIHEKLNKYNWLET